MCGNITFENKYGRLELRPTTYQNVSSIHAKDVEPKYFFSIETAEQIALITGNRGIQLVFSLSDLRRSFVVHHESCDVAAVCEVVSINFDLKIDARAELSRRILIRGGI